MTAKPSRSTRMPSGSRAVGLLRGRVKRAVDMTTDEAVSWRSLAALFIAGGLLVIAVLMLPTRPEGHPGLVLVVALCAVVTGVVLWTRATSIPPRWMSPVLGFGTLLITLVVLGGEQPDGRYALLYFWVAFQAFFFLEPRGAIGHIVGLAVAYGLALVVLKGGVDQWLMVVGTAAVAGWLVGVLRARIDRLSIHARVDSLTGVANRRAFDEMFEREFDAARGASRRLTLVLADLDHFKSVNDHHGHIAGDGALRIFAALAEQTVSGAHVGRLGGDEFAVLMPGRDHQEACELARGLVRAVRRDRQLSAVGVTASMGVAAFPAHGESPKSLLRAADQALYHAKGQGRDRAVAFSSQLSHATAPLATRRSGGASQLQAVVLLAETLDVRDVSTAAHSQTVGRCAEAIAGQLGLDPRRCARIRLAGIVHDLGKIGVPDSVLLKPGALDDEEWQKMRRHPELGAQILDSAGLRDLAAWVLAHHERPDGRGYPHGLRGDEIPLEARILAVADSYEAMTTDRPYRRGRSREQAREELLCHCGTQFDARVVDAFLATLNPDATILAVA